MSIFFFYRNLNKILWYWRHACHEMSKAKRFVIIPLLQTKWIGCMYLKYIHSTYWSLKLKRYVCITCRAISLTSKPKSNLENPRSSVFFIDTFLWDLCACWIIQRILGFFFNLKMNSCFLQGFFFLTNNEFFTPPSDGKHSKKFVLPTYTPVSNFSDSSSKRSVFISIYFCST